MKQNVSASINRTHLSNRIRVVTECIPYVRSVSFGVWLEVGSRNELSHENGISHFIEHMLFKGTTKRSALEIASSIEDIGGSLNAYTSKDLTCYYAHVIDEHLPLAIDVLSDILQNSLFQKNHLIREKQVIIEEIRAIDDVPEERIHEYFYKDLFGEHALGRPISGTVDLIHSFQKQDINNYLNKHYSNQNIIITAAGNLHHGKIYQLLEENFTKLSNQPPQPIQPVITHEPHTFHYREKSSQTHICLGTTIFPYNDSRRFAFLILNTLLGGGMSSRLFQSVREEHGLCYTIYSYFEFFVDTGVFCVYTATDQQKYQLAIDLIFYQFNQLKRDQISDDELQRVKNQLKGNLLLSLESTYNRMDKLAKMELYDKRQLSLEDLSLAIDKVTSREICDLANEFFHEDRITQSILLPNK